MRCLRLIALLCLLSALPAQIQIPADELSLHAAPYIPPPAPGVIRSQVELVELPAVVRASTGAAIPNLTRDDFEIFDSGKKQKISAFSVETFPDASEPAQPGTPQSKPEPPHRYIAIVLDDLNTDAASLSRGKTAAAKFVSESLAPGDLAGIFTTALSQTVEFTANVSALRQAIEAVEPHNRYADDLHECAPIRAYEAYQIAVIHDSSLLRAKAGELMACHHMQLDPALHAAEAKADAIWERASANTADTLRSLAAVVSAAGGMPGQRLVLLTSSGFTAGGEEEKLEALSSAALHHGVIVSAMDLRGAYTVMPGGDSSTPATARGMNTAELQIQTRVEDSKDDPMSQLASATGGSFFHNNNDLALGFKRLAAVPEVVYVLGFNPAESAADGKYHPLKVRLTGGRHGSVTARDGYYAPAQESPAVEARRADRDRLLMSADAPSEVPARIDAEPGTSDTGPRAVTRVLVDIGRLNFEAKKDRRAQRLTVIAALLDRANFVVGRQAQADPALKNRSFEALSSAGLTISLSLHAPPGSYNLRVLVEEELTGKRRAATIPIVLH